MPYEVVKVRGGYKVKKKENLEPRYYSNHPLTKETAYAQMRALYANETNRIVKPSPTRISPKRKSMRSPKRLKSPKRTGSPIRKRTSSPVNKRNSRSDNYRVKQLRSKWSKFLKEGDVEGVISCYDKNPTFKGTMVKRVTHTDKSIKNYFTKFCKNFPKVTFKESKIEKNESFYIDSGTYVFKLKNNEIVEANYQFIYKEIKSEFKIISHYSCLIK